MPNLIPDIYCNKSLVIQENIFTLFSPYLCKVNKSIDNIVCWSKFINGKASCLKKGMKKKTNLNIEIGCEWSRFRKKLKDENLVIYFSPEQDKHCICWEKQKTRKIQKYHFKCLYSLETASMKIWYRIELKITVSKISKFSKQIPTSFWRA